MNINSDIAILAKNCGFDTDPDMSMEDVASIHKAQLEEFGSVDQHDFRLHDALVSNGIKPYL